MRIFINKLKVMEKEEFRHYNEVSEGGLADETTQVLGMGCSNLYGFGDLHRI